MIAAIYARISTRRRREKLAELPEVGEGQWAVYRKQTSHLRGTNEPMMDAAREEEGHSIRIKAPHQRPDTQRCSVRRDDLQPHNAPGPEPCVGHDFRAMVADVHDLARIALGSRFDHHGPRDPSPGMLASIPSLLADHRLTHGNSRARITMPLDKGS